MHESEDKNKDELRARLARDVEEYLAKGGEIEKVLPMVSSGFNPLKGRKFTGGFKRDVLFLGGGK